MTNSSDTTSASAISFASKGRQPKQKHLVPIAITSATTTIKDNIQKNKHRLSPSSINQRESRTSRDIKPRKAAPAATSELQRPQEMSSGKMRQITNQQSIGKQSAPNLGAELWSSVEDLFWDHMKEVENKWNTLKLNDDIWAKLIYFERNRRLAKAYVSAPVLTVDGSTHGLDGFRIGLSGIDSTYRSLDSIDCLRSIGLGIKLKIDNHGNILIRRIAAANGFSSGSSSQSNASSTSTNQHCSVWIKDWPSSSSSATDENCMMRRILKSDISYKLFDMRKFRLQLEKRKLNNEQNMDWRQCVSIISFVRNSQMSDIQESAQQPSDLLENPCWLMLINIIAIDMIKNALSSDEIWELPVQNQSLLELSRQGDQSFKPHKSVGNKQTKSLKISSSSTNLFPAPETDLANSGTASEQSTTGDSSNNLAALPGSGERVKKLRTTGGKYRMSPIKNNAYYRRYQSIQQLSSTAAANNTIYTTFNSKYINRAMNKSSHLQYQHQLNQQDCSSTSDYNSASRSTSSGQLHTLRSGNNQALLPPMDMLQARIQPNNKNRYHHKDDGKVLLFSRKALVPPGSLSPTSSSTSPQLDLGGSKSVSLSTFDLSCPHQPRRFDLRAMPSSIKMNYDYLTETEDLSDYDHDEEFVGDRSAVKKGSPPRFSRNETLERSYAYNSHNAASIMILGKHTNPRLHKHNRYDPPANCCCGLMGGCINEEKLISKHVNHNECSAIQGASSTELVASAGEDSAEAQDKATIKSASNKLSKSSIASSTTSSSGCPDNDYFMSQSSSSMSSSSTSGNGDLLFSQPASSSGIAGSSTNEELDDAQITETKNKIAAGDPPSPVRSEPAKLAVVSDSERKAKVKIDTKSSSDQDLKKTAQNKSLSQKAKKSNSNNNRATKLQARKANQDRTMLNSEYGCDCPSIETYTCHCCCNCFSSEETRHQTLDMSLNENYPSLSNGRESHDWDGESIYQRLPAPAKSNWPNPRPTNRTTSADALTNKTKAKKGDLSPVVSGVRSSAGDESDRTQKSQQKQSVGWLEKRKYSKIFPKFIFSSNNNNNSCQHKDQRNMQLTQEKDSKSRFTRSTLDLS